MFLKNGYPRPLYVYFRSFSNKHQFNFIANSCEKCPSSIWCGDSNPQLSEHESPPITTRPGLPPFWLSFATSSDWSKHVVKIVIFLNIVFPFILACIKIVDPKTMPWRLRGYLARSWTSVLTSVANAIVKTQIRFSDRHSFRGLKCSWFLNKSSFNRYFPFRSRVPSFTKNKFSL